MATPSIQVNFRWPPTLHRQAMQKAKRQDLTLTAYVLALIEKDLKK